MTVTAVGITEIAMRFRTNRRDAVHWTTQPSFPTMLGQADTRPVWDLAQVKQWRETNPALVEVAEVSAAVARASGSVERALPEEWQTASAIRKRLASQYREGFYPALDNLLALGHAEERVNDHGTRQIRRKPSAD